MDDSNNRKKMMQELENERKRNIKPSDLEQVILYILYFTYN